METQLTQSEFKAKTNLPPTVRLQQGARVMFLNNSLMEDGICNGTIGIVTDIDNSPSCILCLWCYYSQMDN